jgi:hypothetical protein
MAGPVPPSLSMPFVAFFRLEASVIGDERTPAHLAAR